MESNITKIWHKLTIKKISSQRSGVRSAGSLETPIDIYEPTIPPQPSAELYNSCYYISTGLAMTIHTTKYTDEEVFRS